MASPRSANSVAIEAPPSPTFLTKKTIGTTAIELGQATGSQIFKPYEIALKVTDRYGRGNSAVSIALIPQENPLNYNQF